MNNIDKENERLQRIRSQQLQSRDPLKKERKKQDRITHQYQSRQKYYVSQGISDVKHKWKGLRIGIIIGLVVWIILAAFGTAAGVLGALVLNVAVGAQFRELLYEVTTTDAVTFISISALTIGVAALASCIPARRAAKVDPMVALRCE